MKDKNFIDKYHTLLFISTFFISYIGTTFISGLSSWHEDKKNFIPSNTPSITNHGDIISLNYFLDMLKDNNQYEDIKYEKNLVLKKTLLK